MLGNRKLDSDEYGDVDHDERGPPEDMERLEKQRLTRVVLLKLDTR